MKLTAADRAHIARKNFAMPAERKYPIENMNHARNALSRASGKPEEHMVRDAVYRKYPHMRP